MEREMDREEYVRMLEEYAEGLTVALIIDMIRRGIFEDLPDEVRFTEKFKKDLFEKVDDLVGKAKDKEEVMVDAIYEMVDTYYGKGTLYEEEIIPRAEIILNYMYDELNDYVESKMGK